MKHLPLIALLIIIFFVGRKCGETTEIIENINRPIIKINEIEKQVEKRKDTIEDLTSKIEAITNDLTELELEGTPTIEAHEHKDSIQNNLIIAQDLKIKIQSSVIQSQDTIIEKLKHANKLNKKEIRREKIKTFFNGFLGGVAFVGGVIGIRQIHNDK